MRRMRRTSGGFTVVELVTSMTIMLLIITVFGGIILAIYHETIVDNATVTIDRDMSVAMDAIETDVRQATTFKTTSSDGSVTMEDYYGYNGASKPYNTLQTWDYSGEGADNRTLLLLQYATNQRAGSLIREPVYLSTAGYNCTTQMKLQPKHMKMAVYFVKNQTLYRRVLYENPSTGKIICGTTSENDEYWSYIAQPSIPVTSYKFDQGYKNTSAGIYRDEVLAHNVSSFRLTYLSDGDVVDGQYDSSADEQSALNGADSVKVELTISSATKGIASSTQTLTIRRVNG